MAMDTTLSDPMVGRLLEGRYAVESFIAHGGMATVYLATDTRLERRVAVKVMHAHLSDDPDTVARFEREARAAARLSSPEIVAIYDQGNESGRAFLVMEYVPGVNLRNLIRDRGRLSAAEALAVMDHVVSALATAHAAGLVHRDVKPENVLVTADGRVKLADFGLARAIAGSTVTTTGSVLLGTAAYLAPEQYLQGTADARSDVYSAGVLLFELLTGSPPFSARNATALLNRHANEDVPAPSSQASDIPRQVDALVTWATSRDPQQRPDDAGELHTSLIEVRDKLGLHGAVPPLPIAMTAAIAAHTRSQPRAGQTDVTRVVGGVVPPSGTGTAAVPRRRRRRGPIIAALVAVVVALAAVGGWWLAEGRYTKVPGGLIGETRAQATQALDAAGLHARWLPSIHSATVSRGEVASVSPSGHVAHGGTIDLRLSLGRVTHPVPKVTSDSVAEATTALQQLHFTVATQPEHRFSQSIDKGLVVTTDPDVDTVLPEGSTVTLVVSKGADLVTIPHVDNLTESAAQDALGAAGFQTSSRSVFSASVTAGVVISSNPVQATKAIKGSAVKLVVSKGPRRFPVPDERGQPIAAAVAAINNAGFKADAQQVFPGGPGKVLQEKVNGQSLQSGQTEPHGTTIVLDWY
jgi:serine/threonine-protein kinase